MTFILPMFGYMLTTRVGCSTLPLPWSCHINEVTALVSSAAVPLTQICREENTHPQTRLVNEAIYLVRMSNCASKQHQLHSSSPLVIDLPDQVVKTSGIRAAEHQASNTVCPGDMEQRERGGGGGGKEGEDG